MTLFIFAGELSGDMYGSRLVSALKNEYSFSGVGGPSMRQQGLQSVLQMEDFEVMGFTDVFRSFPKLWKNFIRVRDHILETSPKAVIFIDYPGFSLRMAKALRKKGYKGKIIQYICPSVWAWGEKRIPQMAETLDLLLTILPFEKGLFGKTSLKVEYVGHPLQEVIRSHIYDPAWTKKFGIRTTDHLVALFPGSRSGEIYRNLPMQLETVKLLSKADPKISFAISCAQESNSELIKEIVTKSGIQHNAETFLIPKDYSYELMHTCRSAMAKSGTVTLELALHKCPTVVMYRLSWLNKLIAKYILRPNLEHYCIVNILAGKRVYPELIAMEYSHLDLHSHLKRLHEDSAERTRCLAECEGIAEMLLNVDASKLAGKAIQELLQ